MKTIFEQVERIPRTQRATDAYWEEFDSDLEQALAETLSTGKAIKVGLAKFHSSPAKGRLWADGMRLRHRVLPDRENVVAWIDSVGPKRPKKLRRDPEDCVESL